MEVVVPEDQISLTIGKRGQNIRLAGQLVGWELDVKSEEDKKQEILAAMSSMMGSSPEAEGESGEAGEGMDEEAAPEGAPEGNLSDGPAEGGTEEGQASPGGTEGSEEGEV